MSSKSHYLDLFQSVTSDTTSDEFIAPGGGSSYTAHLFGSATFVEWKVEVSIDGTNWYTYDDIGYTSLPRYVSLPAHFNWIRFSVLGITGGDVSAVALVV